MQNGTTNVQPPAPAPTAAPTPAGDKTGILGKLQANPWLLHRLLILAVLVGVGVGAYYLGRQHRGNDTIENIAEGNFVEMGKRPVAYMYDGKVPVSRAELGEYLIERFGSERIEFMLNRKIVEMECAKHGISVSNGEVEDRLMQDIKTLNANLTVQDFTKSILRQWGKTLYEYKEDVIRPKLMMEKLIRTSIKVTESDVREGYEARFGPKVECRLIVFQEGQASIAQKSWEHARKGRTEFLEEAKKCFIPSLAQSEGKVPPIHKHFGDKQLEDVAFRLKAGEVSGVLKMKDNTYVILFCENHLPANLAVKYDDVRGELAKEVYDLKVGQALPQAFKQMRDAAKPSVVLDNSGTPSSNVLGAPPGVGQEHVAPKSTVPIPPQPVGAPVVEKSTLPPPPAVGAKIDPMDIRLPAPPPMPLESVVIPEKKK